MKSKSKGKDFCIFALPGLFCFFAVVIVPFIYGVYLTMTDWNGVSDGKNFIGLQNFAGVMKDGQFWSSLLLTFKYVIAVVVFVNVLAFLIAWLLTREIKGQNFFRAGFFTPNLIGGIVLGYIWQFVFSRVFVGIGDATGWGLFEASWLSEPVKAFIALVIVTVWQLSGYMILINSLAFWNDFLLPSLVLSDKKLLTLPLSTYSFYGTYSADYGTIMAGLLLCVIPVLILYIVL